MPGDGKNSEDWSTQDKFSVVLETATMNEAELSEYCRQKGLFVEQIAAWKENCLQGNDPSAGGKTEEDWVQIRQARKKIKQLKRELRRKDRALAETAALLALRKKMHAIWGDDEDE